MAELTRRRVLQYGAAAGASVFLPLPTARAIEITVPGGTLDPTLIPKYQVPLVIPPAMPLTSQLQKKSVDHYVIAVRQFSQQILPPGLPATTVWSYGSQSTESALHYPSFTIEANVARHVRVTWVNGLLDQNGKFLPHLLPVDPTLHWANPPGGLAGRDMEPIFDTTPGPYRGPVPIVTHLHGGLNSEEADGYPEAWYLPDARDIPRDFATVGSFYNQFEAKFAAQYGEAWDRGTAIFNYENDQPATTLWYHDHTLGMTRLNVYAGPAGFYLLRGGPYDLPAGVLPGPAPARHDPPNTPYYEIPIVIQDRSFNADGSLFYPDTRAFFDDFTGPYVPNSDIAPIWNPEFFGNTMVVNGRSWPTLTVEPRRYRFRFLNGCDSRFLILKLASNPLATRPVSPVALPFWQIGAEGGFLPSPVSLESLLMGPAERADVIVDFSGLTAGTEIFLINEAPDEPFGGGEAGNDFDASDPETTGQVMRFLVGSLTGSDTSTPPEQLTLPAPPKPGPETNIRKVSLLEADSEVLEDVGPRIALLGTVDDFGEGVPKRWEDAITENPEVGATEVWEIHNFTEDAHPIHIHEVQFEVVDRQPFEGPARGPESAESGLKDTVIAFPGEITRVRATFDRQGLFVWHCHIIEHEDHEMMRPYRIGP